MKKSAIILGVITIMAFASCKKEVTEETEVVAPAADTTVIVKEVQADTVTVKTEDPDGTSVSVNGDGVSVDSKDGKNKTAVSVKNGEAAVEVKK